MPNLNPMKPLRWLYNKNKGAFDWLAKVVLSEPKKKEPDDKVKEGDNKGIFPGGVDQPKKKGKKR